MATPKETETGEIPPDHRVFIYRIDARDRVSYANGDWYAFARENGADELTASTLIGRPLGDFLCHSETKYLFEILIGKVRRTQMTMVLPYRCDSADRRRFMELTVLPLTQSEVEFRSRILREERRETIRLLATDAARTEESLTMCGWCKKIALPDGRWEEVEAAVAELDLFATPSLPQVSHDICPQCGAAFSRWRNG